MDSQQEYEALLAKWGFDTESQNTANSFYEFSQRLNSLINKTASKIITYVNRSVKPQNLQLGLSH
jgi:hypothetical protein